MIDQLADMFCYESTNGDDNTSNTNDFDDYKK